MLPQEFEQRMKQMLGEEYPAFVESYEKEKYQALRLNPLKVDKGDVSVALEEVPREDWGEQVYKAEIKDNPNLYHKPDYEYE